MIDKLFAAFLASLLVMIWALFGFSIYLLTRTDLL